jgi:hypothetical protein
LVIATLIATSAVAHDNPENWIGQEYRQNALGQICCGKNDCHAFTVDEVTVMPDGYHFPDGEIIAFDKAAPSIDHFFWKCVWGCPEGNKVRLCPARAIMIERENALPFATSGRRFDFCARFTSYLLRRGAWQRTSGWLFGVEGNNLKLAHVAFAVPTSPSRPIQK